MDNRGKRNSNVEILRILAMFMIVSGHFIEQSGFCNYGISINDFLVRFLASGARVSTNIFLIISVWYMVDSEFEAKKIVKMYGQLIFYCWPVTLISVLLFRNEVSMKDIIRGIVPFWGRALWFVSAYITLLLFSPFLKKILELERKQLRLLVVLLLMFFSIVSTLPIVQDAYVCDSMWFMVVYLLIGYIKKYCFIENVFKINYIQVRPVLLFVCGMSVYSTQVFIVYIASIMPSVKLLKMVAIMMQQYLMDIKSLPNLFISLTTFCLFICLKPYSNRYINCVSKLTLSVYIFHQIPAFYPILWKHVFFSDYWMDRHAFYYCIFVYLILFVIVMLLECLRSNFFEKLWLNNGVVRLVWSKLDDVYKEV